MSSGYDLTDKLGYRLMQARLGIYDTYKSVDTVLDSELTGIVKGPAIRLNHQGGSL